MKAKDKAEELIEKYQIFSINHKKLAIQCALIHVNQMIADLRLYESNTILINFYQQVKQEILNRQ